MMPALFLLPAALATPPTPYYDGGACPFACCTYGKWTARETNNVRAARSTRSRIVAKLQG